MMLVGGTEKVKTDFNETNFSFSKNLKHPWEKTKTNWKMLVVPY